MVSVTDPTSYNDNAVSIPVDLKALGFLGECVIRDLWKHDDLGNFSGSGFAPTINYHGAGLYRISPLSK
jgi:hypothetical protein